MDADFVINFELGIPTGTSSKTSSNGAVAVLFYRFRSVVIDFHQERLTIKKSPEIRAVAVDFRSNSAVLSNLRQSVGRKEKAGGPSDSDPRLQIIGYQNLTGYLPSPISRKSRWLKSLEIEALSEK